MDFIMKIGFIIMCSAFLSCNNSTKKYPQNTIQIFQNSGISTNILTQINQYNPEDDSILVLKKGNLNLDNFEDCLIIFANKKEEINETRKDPYKRIVCLLLGQKDSTFILAKQNENLVYHYNLDGNFKDALNDISIENGSIMTEHYGGFNSRWKRNTIFNYDRTKNDWFLIQDSFSEFDATEPEKEGKDTTFTVKDFGEISFSKFNIYEKSRL